MYVIATKQRSSRENVEISFGETVIPPKEITRCSQYRATMITRGQFLEQSKKTDARCAKHTHIVSRTGKHDIPRCTRTRNILTGSRKIVSRGMQCHRE